MIYKRHMLVEISDSGRRRIFRNLCTEQKENSYYASLLLLGEFADRECDLSSPYCASIPAIVRRIDEYTPVNTIAVGFSSWQRNTQGRIKLAGYVYQNEITNTITPYEVTQILLKHINCYTNNLIIDALVDLIEQVKHYATIGIWGSVALEIITGYHYIHEHSDLDIILSFKHTDKIDLHKCHFILQCLKSIEQKYGLRIDPEIELSNGYGISFKELCTDSHSILGKSISDISLLSRASVYVDLNILNCK